MKICHFCGNKNFMQLKTQYSYKQEEKYLLVDDVPCEQCEFCGEQYFHVNVLKKIEKEFENIYSHKKKATRELVIPIENFTELSL